MRLYLAGLEGAIHYDNCREYMYSIKDSLYWLSSFYHTRTHTKIKELISICDKENFLLDSGAFTFRMHGLKNIDIDTYTQEYIDFINKYNIKYFFEMDIDFDEESYKKTLELRNKIESATGKKCIPVWHINRGMDAWYDLLKNYDYVAIGSITKAEGSNLELTKKLIQVANKYKVKVHMLGYNRSDILDYNTFSCDATSWNGGMYGGLWTWDVKTQRPKKQNRKLDKRVRSELQKDLYMHNLKVWVHYQNTLKYKGYWR